MTAFGIQVSYRHGPTGQDMTNVQGDDPDEIRFNLKGLDDDLVGEIIALGQRLRSSDSQAVGAVKAAMPGAQVVENSTSDRFPFSTPPNSGGDNDREAALRAKGFIPDKYHTGPGEGGWWHPKKFEQAPSCVCAGGDKPNQGKLALKVGRSKAGKEFTGWFCVNTFGRSQKAGCSAVFSGQFPEV